MNNGKKGYITLPLPIQLDICLGREENYGVVVSLRLGTDTWRERISS